MTFKDFILECEMYPNSNEAFELMKECAEVTVTAQYLENQRFMAENAALVGGIDEDGTAVEFTEGYFGESVSENDIQVLEEKFNLKISGIGKKIRAGVEKVCKILKSFLTKLMNKFDDQVSRANAIRKALKKIGDNCTDELATAVVSAINHAKSNSGFVAKTHNNNSVSAVLNDIPGKVKAFCSTNGNKTAYLYAALADNYVLADVSNAANNGKYPVAAADLATIIEKLLRDERDPSLNFDTVNHELEGYIKSAVSKGVIVDANSKKLGKTIKTLENIEKMLATEEKEFGNMIKDGEGDMVHKNSPKDAGIAVSELNKIYSTLTLVAGLTSKLYNSVSTYRATALAGIEKALAGAKVDAKAAAKEGKGKDKPNKADEDQGGEGEPQNESAEIEFDDDEFTEKKECDCGKEDCEICNPKKKKDDEEDSE